MKHLFYFHWNEQELEERIKPLRQLPVQITSHWNKDEVVKFTDALPDIFVVSLDRLPSHGRQYVQWLWEAKKRQHIPVIFVDGKPDKIVETKAKFPTAHYCNNQQLAVLVNGLVKTK
jgi:hypothetical protein